MPAQALALRDQIEDNWSRALAKNPKLFNGPIVVPAGLSSQANGPCLDWYKSDYAHFLFSRSTGRAEGSVGSLFVSVALPTGHAEIVVGRMAFTTSFPGILQLPGGGVEVPSATSLNLATVLENASRELHEEVGVSVPPNSFSVVGLIVRSQPLDVGVLVTTAAMDKKAILESFEMLRARMGDTAELTELVFASAEAPLVGGDKADYLDTVLDSLLRTETPQ